MKTELDALIEKLTAVRNAHAGAPQIVVRVRCPEANADCWIHPDAPAGEEGAVEVRDIDGVPVVILNGGFGA